MVRAYKNKPLNFTFKGRIRPMGDAYIIYIKQKEREQLKDYLNQELDITLKHD